MISKQIRVLIVLLLITTVSVATPGCTSAGEPSPAATSPASSAPTATPTPLPPWYYTPKSADWPFNVTDNASFEYLRTNYLVKPSPGVETRSYNYTTIAGNNTTLLLLVYRTKNQEPNAVATQYDIYFNKATGEVINATRGTGPEGAVTGIAPITTDVVGGIDVRSKTSDWKSIREKAGTETVTVPAGTFNCTRYNMRYNETFISSSIWMADFVPAPVKREMYNETGYAIVVYNLTSYSYS